MGTQGLREVAVVLEQVLTDFGRRAADDPRRLKGLLTDTLGARASDLHDAIEVVVAAAEAGIPQAALNDTDRHALVDQARNHLSDPESAEEVVDIWIAALHVQDRIPTDGPTVAPPVEQTLAAGDPTPLPDSGDDPTQLPGSGDDPTKVIPVVGIPPAESSSRLRERITSFTTERKAVVLSAAGILVLALGGVGAAAMWTGNGDATTTTTTVAATTTTSAGETTTTVESLTTLDHEEQVMSWGAVVNRTWEIVDDQLVIKVSAESSEEEATGSVWEVYPESLGVDTTTMPFTESDLITAVHANDHVVRLMLALPPNTNWSFEYSIPLPEGAEDDPLFLENLLAEWELAVTEFLATPPPSLEITSDTPVDDHVTFRGSTTPGAKVQVDGVFIEVAEDGTFEHTAVLTPGDNLVVVRTVDLVRGQATIKELPWTYVPDTTTTTSTSTSTSTTTTTTTTTTAPTNTAPTANCGTINDYAAGVWASYYLNMAKSCFSDSDGTVAEVFATQPNDGFGVITKGNSNCVGAVWCWTYTPPTSWDGAARWVTIHVRAQDDDGAYSPYIQWNICINC